MPSNSPYTGGAFLLRNTKPSSVFIAEEFSDEQKMVFDLVKDFMLREVHGMGLDKVATLDAEKNRDTVLDIFRKASESGLCGVSIDEQYGGMGLDFNTGLLYTEALSLGFSFATTIGCQTSIGSLPIVWYGTEAQKSQYLPGIATGELACSYCLTEPTSGSDANSAKTKAVLNAEKTHYLLNGQKMWITNGGFADVFIVFAKIDTDDKLSAFIVEKKFGGIELGKEEKKMGIKASSTVQVFFNNCPIPVENLLGERGKGFNMALNILNSGRIKIAAGGVGGMKFGLEKAVSYASQRIQFGKPISDFGAIKQKIGKIAATAFVLESGVYRVGADVDHKHKELLDAGSSGNEAKINAMREYAIECALLKIYGSEAMCYSADEAIQIFGGMGYSMETGVEMAYRDARITKIYEGTNEINRMLSLAEFYKRAFQTKELNIKEASSFVTSTLLGNLNPFKSGFLAEEIQKVNNLKSLFLVVTGSAGSILKEKLVDQQEIVMNLADILAVAFITESSFLRVAKLAANPGTPKKDLEIKTKMAQSYLYDALDIARVAANNAIDSYAPQGVHKAVVKRVAKSLLKPYKINPTLTRREIADYVIEKGKI